MPLRIKNKLRIPFSGDAPIDFGSGRGYGVGHSGGGQGHGGHGGGYGGGYGNDQLVLLRPPIQNNGGALSGLFGLCFIMILTILKNSFKHLF